MSGFGAGTGAGGQGFGPGNPFGRHGQPGPVGPDDESEPVIRDRRRIDPQTGRIRDAPGPASGASPFPGAGGPAGQDPRNPANASQPISVDLSAAELDLARQEAAERTADLQRITAEYANYRKRVDRDREVVTATAKAAVLGEMLPVLDDLDRARAHGDLTGSFGAVADKLTAALTKLGLAPVGTVGEPFDPAHHEAVQFGTSTKVTEPTVTAVFRSGYALGDRLIRPAVVVVTGPEHEADDESVSTGSTGSTGSTEPGEPAPATGPAEPAGAGGESEADGPHPSA